jgi:hypothetical protein
MLTTREALESLIREIGPDCPASPPIDHARPTRLLRKMAEAMLEIDARLKFLESGQRLTEPAAATPVQGDRTRPEPKKGRTR